MARHTHAHRRGMPYVTCKGIFLTMWNRKPDNTSAVRHTSNLPQFPGQYSRGDCNSRPHPAETPRSISHAYAVSIEAAQKNIQIVNPYFVPTKSIRKAIKKAR